MGVGHTWQGSGLASGSSLGSLLEGTGTSDLKLFGPESPTCQYSDFLYCSASEQELAVPKISPFLRGGAEGVDLWCLELNLSLPHAKSSVFASFICK